MVRLIPPHVQRFLTLFDTSRRKCQIKCSLAIVANHSTFGSIVKSPKLASVFGELIYVETAPQFQAPKKDGKADKPKAEKPAAAVSTPAVKKEKAKKPANDEDDEEPLVPAEPKAKNPLDDLPKSSFVMDEWKRKYSNEDTLTGALPWFYEK